MPAPGPTHTDGVRLLEDPASATATDPAPQNTADAPTQATAADAATAGPSPSQPAPATFVATVEVLPPEVRARVDGVSWRDGCPVDLEDLRYVTVSHWGLRRLDDGTSEPTGDVHQGELVVHADAADALVEVFRQWFDLGFPIERMALVDDYRADDHTSMLANNTSAFNCRFVAGTQRWSNHAYGRAIDVNPLLNPYVKGSGEVDPPEAARYADRDQALPGMFLDGAPEVAVAEQHGWLWGGHWRSGKDYQHFSISGG